jgi:thiosulfate/3-mercaptopyruvate sulfurtransferase
VLDGGLAAWLAADFEVTGREEPAHFQSNFVPGPALVTLATTQTVARRLDDPAQTLIDARAAPRYRGEMEPLDPVAGHIPGARNRPYTDNFGPDGRFKPAAQLRAEFESLLADRDPSTAVHHCGSGVSALPNLLAMRVAGLGTTALYAGSWSEWSNTPGLPTRQGADA